MTYLEDKLNKIKRNTFRKRDFIIADAKDADMGFGIFAPGLKNNKKKNKEPLSYKDYIEKIIKMTKSNLVDIMLMSASSAEIAHNLKLFSNSKVTPAVRFNDSSDIWELRYGKYNKYHGMPFRTARLEIVKKFCKLGLYAITFSNDRDADIHTLNCYRDFRIDANKNKLDHFLEVFNPKISIGLKHKEIGYYINDCIIKTLSGISSEDRPKFLKIVYNGKAALEELSSYDPTNLIVGILGGSRGTNRDTFELIRQSSLYGAKVALFGRKINSAEDPLKLVGLMKEVASENIDSKDAVKIYHDHLKNNNILSERSLKNDLEITQENLKD